MATLLPMLGGVPKRTRKGSGLELVSELWTAEKRKETGFRFQDSSQGGERHFFFSGCCLCREVGVPLHSRHHCFIFCSFLFRSIMSEPSKPEAVPGNFLEEDDDDDDLFVSAIQV